MEKQNPKRINYFIYLIVTIILLNGLSYIKKVFSPDNFVGGLIGAAQTIFGGIFLLVFGYKFIFYKKWIQTIEKNKKLK